MRYENLMANPFALILEPESVLQAIEHSERLNHLQRRVCRPLDKPLIPKIDTDTESFDRYIDAQPDEPEADYQEDSMALTMLE